MDEPNFEQDLLHSWRDARRLADISQERAGQELGLDRTTVWRIERGQSKLTPPLVLWAIVVWGAPPDVLSPTAAIELARSQGVPSPALSDYQRVLETAAQQRVEQRAGTLSESPSEHRRDRAL